MTPKIVRYLADHQPATPCLVLDLDRVAANFARLRTALPDAQIYYAVKANPAPQILGMLNDLGSRFDAASIEEIMMCLAQGARPGAISFGNTVKKASAIAAAFAQGIDMFAFDSAEELAKIARHAPGCKVYCRIAVGNDGADWPLSRKFGTTVARARDLLIEAHGLGLVAYGLSFHVGSQQTNVAAYQAAIARAAMVFTDLRAQGLDLKMLNLGGGFPVRYRDDVPEIEDFAEAITSAMNAHFGNQMPDMILEPGRFIVGDAGIVASEVVLVCQRDPEDERRWVYLDIGRYGGLAETEGEAIRYDIRTAHRGGPSGPVIIAGPSCDGVDVMYEHAPYAMPMALEAGDIVTIEATGAYVTTYASQAFNGFAPLSEHYI